MRNDPRTGFTVTELIVAIGIFVVIVTIAVGVFVNTVQSQRRLTALMAVNNNAGGVLEQIAREVRTGYRFCEEEFPGGSNPSGPCDLTAGQLTFTNYQGVAVTYALDANGAVTRVREGDLDPLALTALEVEVTRLEFTVVQMDGNGIPSDDVCNPWRITMVMGVRPAAGAPGADEVNLQATVSSRVLPVEAPGAPEIIAQNCQI